MNPRSTSDRRRSLSLLLVGMLLGAAMLTPAFAGPNDPATKKMVKKTLKKAKKFAKKQDAQLSAALQAQIDALGGCGGDPNQVMVPVGPVCIDRYEASVWSAPTGGVQYGVSADDYPCNDNGQDCVGKIYARSVPGVTPSRFITWFQAQQALANSGKRLPTNAEWQTAVAGTPDSTVCNVITFSVASTGANAGCVSSWGANDMVGNLWEWVADWDEQADDCASWPVGYGSDFTCFGAGAPSRFPGAFARGGDFNIGTDAGPFVVSVRDRPSDSVDAVGFRGAR